MAKQGDFSIVISNDMIAEVMGRYFNAEMFRESVIVEETSPTDGGCVFVLSYGRAKEISQNRGENGKFKGKGLKKEPTAFANSAERE